MNLRAFLAAVIATLGWTAMLVVLQ